jgi:peptidoglycan/xylan/chitin deacetylase (PgdA/CDA1 family)
LDEAILERRRRRRAIERRRRAARRRRNFLFSAAVLAFAVGIAFGAGHSESTRAGEPSPQASSSASNRSPDTEPIPPDVPTITDFHDPVPILMYHAISPAPPGAALPGLFVPEAEFEQQMKWLDDNGYHGVTLGQVYAAWNDGEPIAKNPVVISFDDGLQSQYVGARPMLYRLGWPGVLNLEIHHVEQGELTDKQVSDLVDAGWELDSHTFSHPDLTEAGVDLDREIADSRTALQDEFGAAVDFFCYPAGAYDDAVIQAVQDAGYLGATTTNEGLASPNEDPYELSRIRIEPGDGADGLAQKLSDAGA